MTLESVIFLSTLCWYEGSAPGLRSTDNAIESTNATIKRDHTLKERLPESQFLTCAFKMIKAWSMARNPASINCIRFATTSPITLKDWTLACQLAKLNKVLQGSDSHADSNGQTIYFVAAGTQKDI